MFGHARAMADGDPGNVVERILAEIGDDGPPKVKKRKKTKVKTKPRTVREKRVAKLRKAQQRVAPKPARKVAKGAKKKRTKTD